MLLSIYAMAQDSSVVRFYVKGSGDFYMQCNGKSLPHSNFQKLPVGTNDIGIWSPKFKPLYDKIEVKSTRDTLSVVKELTYDPGYISYVAEKDKYRKQLIVKQTIPTVVGLAGIVAAPLFWVNMRSTHEDKIKADFLESIDREAITNRHRMATAGFVTSAALGAAGTTIFFLMRDRMKDLEKPKYKQENPFTLETFELGYNRHINAPQVGMSLSF